MPSATATSAHHSGEQVSNKAAWDFSHAVLGYVEKNGQGKSLKERSYFDPAIAAEHAISVDYEDKNGVRYSQKRRGLAVGHAPEVEMDLLMGSSSQGMERAKSDLRGRSWDERWHVFGDMANKDNKTLNPNCRHYFAKPGLQTSYRTRQLPLPSFQYQGGASELLFRTGSFGTEKTGGTEQGYSKNGASELSASLQQTRPSLSRESHRSSRSLSTSSKQRNKKKPAWDSTFATRPESRLNVFVDPNTRVYFQKLPTKYSKEWLFPEGEEKLRYRSSYAPKSNPWVPRRTRSLDTRSTMSTNMEGGLSSSSSPEDGSSASENVTPEDGAGGGAGLKNTSDLRLPLPAHQGAFLFANDASMGNYETGKVSVKGKKRSSSMKSDRGKAEGFGTKNWHVFGIVSNDNKRLHPSCRHYFEGPGLGAGFRQRGIFA